MDTFSQPRRHYPPVFLYLAALLLLVACSDRLITYEGNCGQQTQQFTDYVRAFVIDRLNPVINEGLDSSPASDVVKKLEELDARASEINVPECNPRTQVVKDALRFYMLETKNYFSTVAGRAVYGEGPVQAQLSKMYEAGLAFEIAFADVRK